MRQRRLMGNWTFTYSIQAEQANPRILDVFPPILICQN